MLDLERVLTDQVRLPGLHDPAHRLRIAVDTGLAEAGDALLGVHQQEPPTPYLHPFQIRDLHLDPSSNCCGRLSCQHHMVVD